MNIPQVPKDITDAKQMQDYMTGIQKALTQKEIDDAKLSEDTKKLIPSVPSIASSAEAIAGTDDTKIITPLKLRNGLNASGSAPIYACRAWVNFNGTGTVAIRASGNVSSITDEGPGFYKINFTVPMEDTNYSVGGSVGALDQSSAGWLSTGTTYYNAKYAVGSVKVGTFSVTNSSWDAGIVNVAIFR